MEYAIVAFINGTWRNYFCTTIADVEALQDVFAKQNIEHKLVTYTTDSNRSDAGVW